MLVRTPRLRFNVSTEKIPPSAENSPLLSNCAHTSVCTAKVKHPREGKGLISGGSSVCKEFHELQTKAGLSPLFSWGMMWSGVKNMSHCLNSEFDVWLLLIKKGVASSQCHTALWTCWIRYLNDSNRKGKVCSYIAECSGGVLSRRYKPAADDEIISEECSHNVCLNRWRTDREKHRLYYRR